MDPRKPANRAGSSDPPVVRGRRFEGRTATPRASWTSSPTFRARARADARGPLRRARGTHGPDGPLAGLTFAVKDNLDVAGHRTGCGQPTGSTPTRTRAPTRAPRRLLTGRGRRVRGQDADGRAGVGAAGENHHYGTPINPAAAGHIPGGSSSGSAPPSPPDTPTSRWHGHRGPVRVPASYCGLCGFTHAREGGCHARVRVPLAPSFDVVGWFARDATTRFDAPALLPPWGAGHDVDLRFDGAIARDAFELCDEETRATLREAWRGRADPGRWASAGGLVEVDTAVAEERRR